MNSAYGNTRLARRLLWVAGYADATCLLATCCATASGMTGFLWFLFVLAVCNVAVVWYASSQGLWFEFRVERIWKATCLGLPGMSGTGRSFKRGCKGAFIDGDTKTIYPKIRGVHGDAKGFTAYITAFGGQDPRDYNQFADKYAFSFQVPFVSFEAAEDGRIHVRAGQVPVPDAYAFTGHLHASQAQNKQPLLQQAVQPPQTVQAQFQQPVPKQVLPIEEVPPGMLRAADTFAKSRGVPMVPNVYAHNEQAPDLSQELELLKAVPMAYDLQGRVCKIPVASNHWFLAARTGGGKSSWIWGLVLRLGPAWAAGLVEFWGIDSKWCELGFEPGWWEHYASKDAECVELLEAAVLEMQARLQSMQGVSRKITPSVLTPLNVVVIDEMAYLTAYQADRKLRDRAQAAISALLSAGRAPGFAIISAVQDPRKDVCTFRDLYSIRIAGGLPAPMCDLVLGEGMYDLGAKVDQVPMGDAGAGAAYVVSERTMRPILVRAPYCSDEAIKQAYVKYSAMKARRVTHTDQPKTDNLCLLPGLAAQSLPQPQYRVEYEVL